MMNTPPIYVVGDKDGNVYSYSDITIHVRERDANGVYSDPFTVKIPESFLEMPLYHGHRVTIRRFRDAIYLWSIDFGDGSRMLDHVKGIQVDWTQTPVRVILPKWVYWNACDYLSDPFDHTRKALKPEQFVTVTNLPPNHFLQHINEKMGDDKDLERINKQNLRLVQRVFDAARSDGIDVIALTWQD